eukprot:1351629-Amphidinium_carterae.1
MRSGKYPSFSFVCVTCTPGALNSSLTHSAWPFFAAWSSGKVPLFSLVCVTRTPGALNSSLTHSTWPFLCSHEKWEASVSLARLRHLHALNTQQQPHAVHVALVCRHEKWEGSRSLAYEGGHSRLGREHCRQRRFRTDLGETCEELPSACVEVRSGRETEQVQLHGGCALPCVPHTVVELLQPRRR